MWKFRVTQDTDFFGWPLRLWAENLGKVVDTGKIYISISHQGQEYAARIDDQILDYGGAFRYVYLHEIKWQEISADDLDEKSRAELGLESGQSTDAVAGVTENTAVFCFASPYGGDVIYSADEFEAKFPKLEADAPKVGFDSVLETAYGVTVYDCADALCTVQFDGGVYVPVLEAICDYTADYRRLFSYGVRIGDEYHEKDTQVYLLVWDADDDDHDDEEVMRLAKPQSVEPADAKLTDIFHLFFGGAA